MSKFHIRFNVYHGDSPLVWRIFEDGVEHLATDFRITVPMHGEATEHETGEVKWNVACEGELTWDGTIAIISDK